MSEPHTALALTSSSTSPGPGHGVRDLAVGELPLGLEDGGPHESVPPPTASRGGRRSGAARARPRGRPRTGRRSERAEPDPARRSSGRGSSRSTVSAASPARPDGLAPRGRTGRDRDRPRHRPPGGRRPAGSPVTSALIWFHSGAARRAPGGEPLGHADARRLRDAEVVEDGERAALHDRRGACRRESSRTTGR